MLKEQDGTSVELPQPATGKYLEHQHCEIVREVFDAFHTAGLNRFIFSLIDSFWNDLSIAIHHLERLPEETFKELMEVIEGLTEARNELRHARFLFDVEEINPLHRLIMRNKALSGCRAILCKVLRVWPLHSPSSRPQG